MQLRLLSFLFDCNLLNVAVASPNIIMLARELSAYGERLGRRGSLVEFCTESMIDAADVYRRGSCTDLRRRAGAETEECGLREAELSKALRPRLQEIGDPERLAMLRRLGTAESISDDVRSQRLAQMLGFVLLNDCKAPQSTECLVKTLQIEPAIRRERLALSKVLEDRSRVLTSLLQLSADVPLHLHSTDEAKF